MQNREECQSLGRMSSVLDKLKFVIYIRNGD